MTWFRRFLHADEYRVREALNKVEKLDGVESGDRTNIMTRFRRFLRTDR